MTFLEVAQLLHKINGTTQADRSYLLERRHPKEPRALFRVRIRNAARLTSPSAPSPA